jgi:hypothetical protein
MAPHDLIIGKVHGGRYCLFRKRITIMIVKPLLVFAGATFLAGCVYSGQPGVYSTYGYPSSAPNYYGYQPTYQPAYQPAQATYQTHQYDRPAPYPYPLYSPQYPPTDSGGRGG